MDYVEMTRQTVAKAFPNCNVREEKRDEHITVIHVEDDGHKCGWAFDDREDFLAVPDLDQEKVFTIRARDAARDLFDLKMGRYPGY